MPREEKMVIEREKARACRAAFMDGALFAAHGAVSEEDAEAEAKQRYPLPKATRPRAVRDPELPASWRVVYDTLQFRVDGADGWHDMLLEYTGDGGKYGDGFVPTPARVALWADLFAHPTEEVNADA